MHMQKKKKKKFMVEVAEEDAEGGVASWSL